MSDTMDRSSLRRVIAVANGKGGVGKTSVSSHLAGLAAAAGFRTLLVDLDPQGNLGEDLGYTGAGLSDEGQSLAQAISYGTEPARVTEVRPGLDVIPGGEYLDELAAVLETRRRREGDGAAASLAQALAPIAGEYALVVIDCPPAQGVLQEAALVAAQWLVIPTKTDQSSRKGLREIARRFVAARAINPELGLLGVVLFGVTSNAKRVHSAARDAIEEELGGAAPVFEATIRHVEAAAFDIRNRGQLAHELERDVLSAPLWWEVRSGSAEAVPPLAASAKSLAADYQALTEQILGRMTSLEQGVAS